MCPTGEKVAEEPEEGVIFPAVGVTGGCELPDMDAGYGGRGW